MEEVKFDINIFRQQFFALLKELDINCEFFNADITNAKDAVELKKVFCRYAEEIAEELGLDIDEPEECEHCSEKDDEISELEDRIEELEQEIDNKETPMLSIDRGTIIFDMKLRVFLENQHQFSLDDIEQFMLKKLSA